MSHLVRFRSVFIGAALLVAPACSKETDTKRDVDRAAERVNETASDLREPREVDDRSELAESQEDADALERASADFMERRSVRVQTMRAVHAIAASQAMVVHALTEAFPLVDQDRAEVSEKLQIFQMRLDEAGNAIQSLELVEPADWESRGDEATRALERVEDAREDAWEALNDADRIGDRTSMR